MRHHVIHFAAAAALTAAAVTATAPAGTTPSLATEIVAQGLQAPTYATFAPNDPNASRIFVIQQNGVIRVIKDGALLPTPYLDLNPIVPNQTFNGLIGIAFHPDYQTNGYFYLHHPLGPSSNNSNRISIARYTVSADPDVADPASRDEIMVLDYPDGLPFDPQLQLHG